MQPATDQSGGPGGALRRWGPIIGIALVAAIVAALVVGSGGDDDPEAGGDGGTGGGGPTEATTAGGEPIFPFSWADGESSGIGGDLDWGDRCDTERGTIAVPDVSAPSCYLPFDGDNGGATAQGVTADTIKIVVYLGPDNDPVINYIADAVQVDETNADTRDTLDNLIRYYETYYETYGRRLEVEYYESEGIATDATTARADAVAIAEDMKPFQVWGGPALTEAFGDELAARGIQCISCADGSQAELEERAPYGFGLGTTTEQARAHNVEAIAKQVAGRKAEHAGDPSFRDQERVFGYLHIETTDPESAADAEKTVEALEEAGVEIAERVPYALDPATLQETARNGIARLKEAGVTTVIFAGDPVAPRDFTRAATSQDYFPEWFVNVSALVDTNVFARTYDPEQWKNAFGLTALAARVDPEKSGSEFIYEWFFGESPAANDTIGLITPAPSRFYEVLQEVGPNLTHESFRDAIFRLEPTPSRLTDPSSSWGQHDRWPGLDGDDYEGIDDITKIWWDPNATGPDEIRQEGEGLWRYVDGGRRYLLGDWPEEEFKAFDEEGTSTIYDEVPEDERPPDYEPLSPE